MKVDLLRRVIAQAAEVVQAEVRVMPELTRCRLAELREQDPELRSAWRPQAAPASWLTKHLHREVCLRAVEMLVHDEATSEAQKVSWIATYLTSGRLPQAYYEPAFNEISRIAVGLAKGEVAYQVDGPIALMASEHKHVLRLGFCLAPVVIVANPHFRFGGGEDLLKYTVAQWRLGYCDMHSLWIKMAYLEIGWGGNGLIGGSPQGSSSVLSMEEVRAEGYKYCYHPWYFALKNYCWSLLV